MSRMVLTKQANNVYSYIVTYGCCAFGVSYYVKHTFLLNHYKKYTELQGIDGPVNPSEQLVSLVTLVQDDVKDFASKHTSITPYIVPGMRTVHMGTFGTLYGGIIGLPAYFEFNKIEDVDNKVKKADSSINEDSIEESYSCFLLSDNAKKYGIAKEILSVNTFQVYIETCLPGGIGYFLHLFSTTTMSMMNVHHPVGKGLLYVIISAFGLSLWRTTHAIIRNYFEGNIENDLATLGPDYLEGGVEFYSKALERKSRNCEWNNQNTSLINTISDKIHPIVSSREISLSYKLAFYKAKLEEYMKNNNKEVSNGDQEIESNL